MNTLRQTAIKGWYEYYREVCPVCSKSGGCMINEKGDTAVCIRVESKVVFSTRFQSWVHRLTDVKPIKRKNQSNQIVHPKASPGTLDMVYRVLQQCLNLQVNHLEHLTGTKRAMTESEVRIREYRSFPSNPSEVINKMLPKESMKLPLGIPGFYKKNGKSMLNGFQGIMIPFRNQYNQIIGYQIRVDKPRNDIEIDRGGIEYLEARVIQPDRVQIYLNGENVVDKRMNVGDVEIVHDGMNTGTIKMVTGQRYFWLSSSNKSEGTGAGSPLPIHVAVSSQKLKEWTDKNEEGNMHSIHQTESIWVTEGGLKADISSEHIEKVYSPAERKEIGSTVLAVPGVNTWKSTIPILEEMGVKRVNIAFDMDVMSNDKVQYQLKEYIIELKKMGYVVYLAMWNEDDGKGLDDVFINRRIPQLRKM